MLTAPMFFPTYHECYTVESRYYRGQGESKGVAIARLLFQGSKVLEFHVLDEQWPCEKNRSKWYPIIPGAKKVLWEAHQWEYCRRMLYGSLALREQKPDLGTAKLVDPLRVALEAAFEKGKEL